MKKTIYILGIAAGIGILGYLGFIFLFKRPGQQINPAGQPGALPPIATSTNPKSISDSFPKTPTIDIGTSQGVVEVKNFYIHFAYTEEGSLILKDGDDYSIGYKPDNSGFLIYLKTPPLASAREKAENDFLDILGISQSDACKLTVRVATAPNGENSGLSFCFN